LRYHEIAPGSILQRLYLGERLRANRLHGKRFLELGAGTGMNSHFLLESGLTGVGFDLNERACARNREVNATHVAAGRYEVVCGDFLAAADRGSFDVVFSCMVLEHLAPEQEASVFSLARAVLAPGGVMVLLVPSCPAAWGIEDEIAGHQRRYTRPALARLAAAHGFEVRDLAGLTYPLSNLLLPLSNWIIRRAERRKLALSEQERTVLAGRREVLFKTDYPGALRAVLNDVTMAPLHWLQKACRNAAGALVLYAEMAPAPQGPAGGRLAGPP